MSQDLVEGLPGANANRWELLRPQERMLLSENKGYGRMVKERPGNDGCWVKGARQGRAKIFCSSQRLESNFLLELRLSAQGKKNNEKKWNYFN